MTKAWNKRLHGFRVAAVFVLIAAIFASMLGVNPQEVRAYDTTTTIYRWHLISNWDDFSKFFPKGQTTKMLIVNSENGHNYFSTGSNFYYISNYYAYHDRYGTRVAALETEDLFDPSLDTVYTIGDCNAWGFVRTDWDEGHIRMANGTYLCCHDGSDTCLTNKTSADYTERGDRVWCFYTGAKGYFKIRYNASGWFHHDNYMGFHGNTMFCESRKEPGDWHQFRIYAGEEMYFSNLQQVEVAQPGTVTNYAENILIREGTVLVIPPTAVVSIQGHLWLNGEIRNYGTLVLRTGSEMAELNGTRDSWAASCSITNYGSSVCYEENELMITDYEAWKRETGEDVSKSQGLIKTRTQGEGNLIVMEDAILALNKHSRPIKFTEGSSLINYGTIISPYGYIFENATAYNYGLISLGWYYRVMGQDIHSTKSASYSTTDGYYYDEKFTETLGSADLKNICTGKAKASDEISGTYINKGTLGYKNIKKGSDSLKSKINKANTEVWK